MPVDDVAPVDELGREARRFDIVLDAPTTGDWRVEGVVPQSGERWR